MKIILLILVLLISIGTSVASDDFVSISIKQGKVIAENHGKQIAIGQFNAVIKTAFSASKCVHLAAGKYKATSDIILPENGILEMAPDSIIQFANGRNNVVMSSPHAIVRGGKIKKGGILIITSHTLVQGVTVTSDGSVLYNLGGAFKVKTVSGQTLEDHIFKDCIAIDCKRHGFLNEANGKGAPQEIKNQKFINCQAIRCGATATNKDWYVGFDLNECPTNVLTIRDILLTNCRAEDNLESGFHLEQAPKVYNVILRNCTSANNGLIKRGVSWEYGSGFYIRNGVTLENCTATGNHFGIYVAIGKGNPSEPVIIKGCITSRNAANPWIKYGADYFVQPGCENVKRI